MNLYEVLGVPPTADEREIKRAYREKSKTTHPDQGGSDEAFRKSTEFTA